MEKSKKRNLFVTALYIIVATVVFISATLKITERIGYTVGLRNCTCQTEKECVNKQEIKIDKYGTFNKIQSCRN